MEEKIIKLLEGIKSEIVEYQGNSMLEESIIDSFDIVDIMTELEEMFSVEIGAEYAIAENFRNKEAIIEMMKQIV